LNHSFSTPQPTKLAANVLLDTSGHLHGVNALAASFLAAFGRKVLYKWPSDLNVLFVWLQLTTVALSLFVSH